MERFTGFDAIEQQVLRLPQRPVVALANAQDDAALAALVQAQNKGVVKGILIGDEGKIRSLLAELGARAEDYEIVSHVGPESEAAALAVSLVRQGRADIPMKGLMQTSSFMRAVLDKEGGLLPPGALLGQAAVFEFADPDTQETRLMIVSDCAVNISPDYAAKEGLIRNVVHLANRLGIEEPRVAVVTPLEEVNEKILSTVDAAELVRANKAGKLAGCVVGGPLALDNALSRKAAAHKGIEDPVAGRADILLMPDLCAGNIFFKSLVYIAGVRTAAALCGTRSPVVMTSRTDTVQNKYYSILLAAFTCTNSENLNTPAGKQISANMHNNQL